MRDEENDSKYASQAARALAAVQPSTVPPPLTDRAEAIDAIERALRARARQRGPRRWALPAVGVVMVAAAMLVVLPRWDWSRERTIGHRSGGVTAEGLVPGTELRGPRSIELASGTRLQLDESARASVLETGPTRRFRLDRGELRAEVAKLATGQRFLVQTADTEVEVKGTRFDVAMVPGTPACVPATRTRVTVHEGIVAVRFAGTEVHLGPDSTWPDCTTAGARITPATRNPSPPSVEAEGLDTAAREAAAPGGPTRARAAGSPSRGERRTAARAVSRVEGGPTPIPTPKAGSPSPAPPSTSEAAQASTLADQNDLLAAALAALHRGDRAEALRWLDRLLSRYPGGQLAESARAERRRLLDSGAIPPEQERR